MAIDIRLESILEQLDRAPNSLTAALYFEQLVLGLLDARTRAENRPSPTTPVIADFVPDGFLPGGIGDLDGPAVVEVAFLTGVDDQAVRRLMEKLDRSAVRCQQLKIPSLLVVHNKTFSAQQSHHIAELAEEYSPLRVAVWDRRSLQALLRETPGLTPDLFSGLARSVVEERIALEESESASLQSSHLATLGRLYGRDGVSLFLGAGVSAGLGLPGWSALVGALFTAAFSERLSLSASEAAVLSAAAGALNSDSPLQTARYLRRALGDEAGEFEEELSKVLYGNYDPESHSALLDAIARLCVPGRLGAKVHSIVTYNFDDLLEGRLAEKHVDHVSIYHANGQAAASELPVYHAHGFLPRNRESFEKLEESLLAFSEEGYHRLYSDPYHWSNIVQLNAIRERTCVFLGLSLTDPNLRRLLELGARGTDSPRHFAFMRRTPSSELVKAHGAAKAGVTREKAARFLSVHHAVQEAVLAELGINVIWFDDFRDMPAALLSVAHAGG